MTGPAPPSSDDGVEAERPRLGCRIRRSFRRGILQAVVNDHSIAVKEVVAGIHNRTLRGRQYRRAGGCGDVHAGMGIARLAIEHAAQAK